ncbi:MAG: hypothetical protein IJS69_03305 [Selenomonadaceae bacterium]|nr:hypothetical protein [Selenomonadaceae bacterium]
MANYWIHRVGRGVDCQRAIHFDALWYLLKNRRCLTSGWQNFVGNANIVSAVERGDSDGVKKLARVEGFTEQQSRGLINFSQFNVGDIIAVLPIPEYEENFLVVEIKTRPQKILSVPPEMQAPFTVDLLEPSGRDIVFRAEEGFIYDADKSPVDAGFFCEVDILKSLPLSDRSPEFKILCDNVRGTNAPLTNYNNAMISLTKFYSRIAGT